MIAPPAAAAAAALAESDDDMPPIFEMTAAAVVYSSPIGACEEVGNRGIADEAQAQTSVAGGAHAQASVVVGAQAQASVAEPNKLVQQRLPLSYEVSKGAPRGGHEAQLLNARETIKAKCGAAGTLNASSHEVATRALNQLREHVKHMAESVETLADALQGDGNAEGCEVDVGVPLGNAESAASDAHTMESLLMLAARTAPSDDAECTAATGGGSANLCHLAK